MCPALSVQEPGGLLERLTSSRLAKNGAVIDHLTDGQKREAFRSMDPLNSLISRLLNLS